MRSIYVAATLLGLCIGVMIILLAVIIASN
ncbi:hypothetical protein ES708_14390 [subsurface metagenome]